MHCAAPMPRAEAHHGGPNSRTMMVSEDIILKYEARIKELEEENEALKRKQMEISTAKELYLKIFEDFPALIWRSRLDKLCDYFNRTWLEWTGKTQEEEFGNGWTHGIHPDDYDGCLDTYVKAFDKRESFYMEYRLKDKHGEYRWIGDHGRPFYDLDETFLGYIGSCYDITDNKRNEQNLIKVNATKDKFFSIVAHDLRNPIAAFVSVSELLMEDHGDLDAEDMKEIATEMHKDSKNTLLLLENLLEWSRAQSDEIKFTPVPVRLGELCQEVLTQVQMVAKGKKISIQFEEDLQGLVIDADKNMLRTVFRNLLMNAIKFTSKGGHVHLKAERYQGDVMDVDGNAGNTHTVMITVSDSGVGISKQTVSELFDLDKSTRSMPGTENEGGSGLGLVICKDFVEKHGGKIWVESVLGNGTDFKLTIPSASSTGTTPKQELLW